MGSPAVFAGRPRFDIADIVRAHRAELEASSFLSTPQRRVLSAIAVCRTAVLGGHVDVCHTCGYEHPAYNSCRNRHCPKCQAIAQERWITARTARILPVGHFHVVFTLPAELRRIARYKSRRVFNALMQVAGEILLQLGKSRLGANPGVTLVLHTWTRDLRFHPHVHAIVTAGGLGNNPTRWVHSNPKFLFPVRVMGKLWRGKMLAALRCLKQRGLLGDQPNFENTLNQAAKANWVVYAKKPFRYAEHVLKYLGRYTHRVGIANSRLVHVDNQTVTFLTKNGKVVNLTPVTFLKRLVQHVLPAGFKKIRHYGLYSGASVGGRLKIARSLLNPNPTLQPILISTPTVIHWSDLLHKLTGRDISRCPRCGNLLAHLPVSVQNPRAPPRNNV